MMLKPTLLKQRTGTATRVWALAFTAFFLLGAAWAVAMPYDGPPDELQHVTRAYGVAAGQIYAGPVNAKVRTAKSLVPRHVGCFRWNTTVSARCMQTPGANVPSRTKRVSYKSDASGYNPSYYLFVGPVLHVWPDMRGIIVARLLTDAEISALLASALAIAWRSRDRWLIAGIAVCVTPVVVNLMGAVNPAGVEIGAAVALWVSLLDLLEPRPVRPLVVAVALWSGSVLAVTRGFGVGWLAAIAAVCAFGAGWSRLRTLWQLKRIRWTALGIAIASAAAIAWDLLAGANFDLSAANAPKTKLIQVVAQELWLRVPYYLDGMVRLTSYGDILVPQTLSAIWFGVLGLIVLGGFWLGTTRARIQIAAIVGVSLAMLVVTDVDAVRQGFWFSQGRYALPLLVGAPMIGAVQIGRSTALSADRVKSLLRLIAVALLPMQMVALWSSMLRFQHGFPANGRLPLNVLTGTWLPPYGPLLPLILMTGGLAVFAWGLCGTPSLRPRFGTLARLDRVVVRFVLVGAAVYAIDMAALWLLHAHAGLPLALATTLAFCCAFVANLTLNRTFTFGAPGSVGLQGAKLLATAGLNYVSTLLIVLGLAEFWNEYLVSKTIATAINAAFNFVLYRHWVFASASVRSPRRKEGELGVGDGEGDGLAPGGGEVVGLDAVAEDGHGVGLDGQPEAFPGPQRSRGEVGAGGR
jgi:putative flippase GtrA